MNSSLELRNRINKMRLVNNLEPHNEKLLTKKEKNNLDIKPNNNNNKTNIGFDKKNIENISEKISKNNQLNHDAKDLNGINSFQNNLRNEKNYSQNPQLKVNEDSDENYHNEAQFRMLANKFNEAVEVILELSEKVNKLENLIYTEPAKEKKTMFFKFLSFKSLCLIIVSILFLPLVLSHLTVDISLFKVILNEILTQI